MLIPDVTVITVCLNAGNDLIRTCESVLGQSGVEVQLIIQDGGSNGHTLDYLTNLSDPRVSVVLEPDQGIYDAMNRAFKLVNGKWCIYLNAGDYFNSDNSLRMILDEVHKRDQEELLDLVIFSFINEYDGLLAVYPKTITKFFLYRSGVNHQAQLWKSDTLRQYLPFNTNYQILADQHLFLRAFLSGIKIYSSRIVGTCYKDGGVSSQKQVQSLKNQERANIRVELFDPSENFIYSFIDQLLTLKSVRLILFRIFRKTPLAKLYRKLLNSFYVFIG